VVGRRRDGGGGHERHRRARRGFRIPPRLGFWGEGRFLPPGEVDRVAGRTLPSGLSLTDLSAVASVQLKRHLRSFPILSHQHAAARNLRQVNIAAASLIQSPLAAQRLLFHGGRRRRRRGGDGEARGAP